jgi:invasion protein IalB
MNVRLLAAVCAVFQISAAQAQQRPPAAASPSPQVAPSVPAPAPAPGDQGPEQTTATFGDWTLRCQRTPGPPPLRTCEIAQAAQAQGQQQGQAQTVMQVAIGRVARTEPWRLTVALPTNIFIQGPIRLAAEEREPALALAWQRCVPGGCFASAEVREDTLRRLRARTEAARIEFKDAAERDVQLPVSFRGFAQAFEALVREP